MSRTLGRRRRRIAEPVHTAVRGRRIGLPDNPVPRRGTTEHVSAPRKKRCRGRRVNRARDGSIVLLPYGHRLAPPVLVPRLARKVRRGSTQNYGRSLRQGPNRHRCVLARPGGVRRCLATAIFAPRGLPWSIAGGRATRSTSP